MADEHSLGSRGPNITSIEAVSDTVYSVQGHQFAPGMQAEVRDGLGKAVAGVTVSRTTPTAFTLELPYTTPGPYTLVVINPDARTSTSMFATPGTSASNQTLRTNS